MNRFSELEGMIVRLYRSGISVGSIANKLRYYGMSPLEIAKIVQESQIGVEFDRLNRNEITIIVPSIINYNINKYESY